MNHTCHIKNTRRLAAMWVISNPIPYHTTCAQQQHSVGALSWYEYEVDISAPTLVQHDPLVEIAEHPGTFLNSFLLYISPFLGNTDVLLFLCAWRSYIIQGPPVLQNVLHIARSLYSYLIFDVYNITSDQACIYSALRSPRVSQHLCNMRVAFKFPTVMNYTF